MDYEYFKKSLVRIAIMAQDYLGGLKDDLFIEKLEEETKKKQEESRKREMQKKKEYDKIKVE